MYRFDVIVAGLGAMGSAALDRLSARGARVLGIDPFGIAHGHGSSGGDSRLIRKAYFEHPDYVPLLERAYEGWRSLEADSGVPLLHRTGIVYLGAADGDLLGGSRRSAEAHGLALEPLPAAELTRRYPQFRLPDGYAAALEPEAGFVLSERAIRAQVERACARGATIAVGERLLRWRTEGDGLQVFTDRGRYAAGALVIAAGSWSGPLLAELGVDLRVTRQPLFWVQPADPAAFSLGRVPCWAVERLGEPGLYYGVPALPGALSSRLGVKLAHHHPGDPADPEAPRGPADGAELERLLAAVAPFLPDLGAPSGAGATGEAAARAPARLTGSHVCLYTMSPDGHFIVDRHPADAHVAFACGFSGHGFKFAPVIGELLSDLVLEGRSRLPGAFLGLR